MASFVYFAYYCKQAERCKSATICMALNDNYLIIAQLFRADVNHTTIAQSNWKLINANWNIKLAIKYVNKWSEWTLKGALWQPNQAKGSIVFRQVKSIN